MDITLKPEQEKLILQQVALGRFSSADEALERALQLLHEEYDEAWIADIQAKVDEAKAAAEREEVLPLDTVMNRLQEKFRHNQVSTTDVVRFKQLLTHRPEIPMWSPAEQQARNQVALQKLQEIMDRDQQQPFTPEAQQRFEEFQQLVDEQRPVGQKLFSE